MTIAAYGRAVHIALATAAALREQDGIAADVIDLRTIVPLDMETVLASVRRTGRLVVVHEAHRNVGFGAEIAARVAEAAWGDLRAPVRRVAGLDMPVPYAQPLETAWLPQPEDVAAAVRLVLRP